MIHDPRVLDDEVVPDPELILHRRDEMDALLSALRPRMNARDHVYAFGPTGTGKSTLAKLALTLLEDDGEEFDSTVVNCWKHPTRSDVLRVIAGDLVGIPVNPLDDLGEVFAAAQAATEALDADRTLTNLKTDHFRDQTLDVETKVEMVEEHLGRDARGGQ